MNFKKIVFFINILCINYAFSLDDAYSLVEAQNKRLYMQDSHDINITKDDAFFGVYDGHGDDGDKIAKFAANNVQKKIKRSSNFAKNIPDAIIDSFIETHNEMANDKKLKEQSLQSGTTATIAIIRGNKIYIGNAGDSRTVISSRSKIVSSVDHKPNSEIERKRIESIPGGFVSKPNIWRVQGHLATARSLGDVYLNPYVTPLPDVVVHEITPQDEFMILGSDGIWDDINNEEAVEVVRKSKNIKEAAENLKDLAIQRGAEDNITVLIVDLRKTLEKMKTLANEYKYAKLQEKKNYDDYYK